MTWQRSNINVGGSAAMVCEQKSEGGERERDRVCACVCSSRLLQEAECKMGNPKSFKIPINSPLANTLKSSISQKLHEFLGNYSDDVLAVILFLSSSLYLYCFSLSFHHF